MKLSKHTFILGAILIAAFSRLIPHPYNFTPMIAITLFGIVNIKNSKIGVLAPLVAWIISDVLVNVFIHPNATSAFYFFSKTALGVYSGLLFVMMIGLWIRQKPNVLSIFSGAVLCGVVFYIISNTFVWLGLPFYPQNFAGWLAALTAGIPFYQNQVFGSFFFNQIFGDVFFTGLLFGAYWLSFAEERKKAFLLA